MSTPSTDEKMLVNAAYHSAVSSGLAASHARLGEMVLTGATPKA